MSRLLVCLVVALPFVLALFLSWQALLLGLPLWLSAMLAFVLAVLFRKLCSRLVGVVLDWHVRRSARVAAHR